MTADRDEHPARHGARRRDWLAAMAWALGPASVPGRAAAASAPVTVPMQRLRTGDIGGLVAIEAVVGHLAGLWLVDTGSTIHLVDRVLARQLRLPVEGLAPLSTAGGRQQVPRVRLPGLRPAGSAADASGVDQALAVDLQALRDVADPALVGVLGLPMLVGRRTRFDFAAGLLAFDVAAPAAAAGRVVGMNLDTTEGLATLSIDAGPGLAGPALLDTGNAGALVLYARAAEQRLKGRAPVPVLSSRELGGTLTLGYARAPSLDVGGFRRREVPLALERGSGARRGGRFERLLGSLGNAVFEGTAWTLDWPAARLTIEAGPDLAETLPGGFGFVVTRLGDQLQVERVMPRGPAAAAGWRPGDTILAVDGAAAGPHPALLWSRLHDREDALFGLQRGSARWQARLRRGGYLPSLD